jgi:D-glycero-alpha-D-manno-heptose-7-phosphate kinase
MIISRTPFRVSFFGGGTDFKEWYEENGGAVLSCSIDKYCYISLRKLPPFFSHKHRIVYSEIELVETISEIKHPAVRACLDFLNIPDGLEIHYDGDLPSRSGLGSSSSFTVGLLLALKAYQGRLITQKRLADAAIHIERERLQEAGGVQDQIAASFGGLNFVEFNKNGYSVRPVIISRTNREALESSLCLFYTGKSRLAEAIEKSKISQIKDKSQAYKELHALALKGKKVLEAPNFNAEAFGELLQENWALKKSLAKEVANPHLDEVFDLALSNGALGGKLLGAGGNGFLLFCVERYDRQRLIEALSQFLYVPFSIDTSGAQIALYQP